MSAQILSFTSLPRSKAAQRKAAFDVDAASVVILPCVRYERWSDDDANTPSAPTVQFASAHC